MVLDPSGESPFVKAAGRPRPHGGLPCPAWTPPPSAVGSPIDAGSETGLSFRIVGSGSPSTASKQSGSNLRSSSTPAKSEDEERKDWQQPP